MPKPNHLEPNRSQILDLTANLNIPNVSASNLVNLNPSVQMWIKDCTDDAMKATDPDHKVRCILHTHTPQPGVLGILVQ